MLYEQSIPSTINQHGKNKIWNSERVDECVRIFEEFGDVPGGTPFHEGDKYYKAGDIVYEYTDYELSEIAKCATDVVYFADKYAHAMTDYGVQKITLRDYQKRMLKTFQDNRFVVGLASRQIGKTLYRQSIIEIKRKSSNQTQKITFYEFFYTMIKKKRSLTIHEKLIYFLSKIESLILFEKIYNLTI